VSPVGLALMGARGVPTRSTAGGARWRADQRSAQVLRGVVRQCRGAELAAFFTDDAVYHNIPMAPVTAGRPSRTTSPRSSALARQESRHPVPRHQHRSQWSGRDDERVDVFKLPAKSFELPVMGTFEVSEGKISAWRDYFDMNQFTSRMG